MRRHSAEYVQILSPRPFLSSWFLINYIITRAQAFVCIDQGGMAREFVFNLNGQRTSIWDGNSGNQIQGQVYWGAMPIEFYAGGSAHFQHQDWLGTERMRTSYSGSVEGTFTSLPFGDGYSFSGSDNDPYHYATLDKDYYGSADSQTDRAQFRQYSDAQGRWMSPDPYDGSYDFSNPQSFNRYSYVLNNPLAFTDPSGLVLNGLVAPPGCTTDDSGDIICFLGAGLDGIGSAPSISDLTTCWGPRLGGCTNATPKTVSVRAGGAPSNCSVTIRCRPLNIPVAGKLGFQHCSAMVTDSGGTTTYVSGGPVNSGPYKGKLGGWATTGSYIPADATQGTIVYSGSSCQEASCIAATGTANQNDPTMWPNYNLYVGPNSNDC